MELSTIVNWVVVAFIGLVFYQILKDKFDKVRAKKNTGEDTKSVVVEAEVVKK